MNLLKNQKWRKVFFIEKCRLIMNKAGNIVFGHIRTRRMKLNTEEER